MMPPKTKTIKIRKTYTQISQELAADLEAIHGIKVPVGMTIEVDVEIPEDETYGYDDYFEEDEVKPYERPLTKYEKGRIYRKNEKFLWGNGCHKNNIDKEWYSKDNRLLGKTVNEAAAKLIEIMKAQQ